MTEIIEEFIRNRLNRGVNFADIEKHVRLCSGSIIAELLCSYKIISLNDYLLIETSTDAEIIARNYEHIRTWLLAINIEIDEECYNELISCTGSAILYLLYELYLTLNDKCYLKNKLYSVKITRKTKNVHIDSENNLLEKILVQNDDKVDWKTISYEKLLQCYKAKKKEFAELCQQNEKNEVKNPDISSGIPKPFDQSVIEKSCNEFLEELIKIESMENFDNVECAMLMKKLRKKVRKKETLNVVRYKLQRMLLDRLWQLILEHQNRVFEKNIRGDVLKQSDYEQKAVTKETEENEIREEKIRQLKEKFKQIREREDELFVEKLLENKDDIAREYYENLCAKLKIHQKLYQEKLKQKQKNYATFCENVFDNLVNVAINFSEYREQYNCDPNWREKFAIKNLFVEGKPVLEELDDEDFENYCECEDENVIIETIETIETDTVVNNLLNKYQNYEEPFNLEDDEENETLAYNTHLGSNILGYIVYKLLFSKYPNPSVPTLEDIPLVEVRACLIGLPDLEVLQNLQALLNEKEIAVIQISDCINFCLNAYKTETIMEYEDLPSTKEGKGSKQEKNNKKGKKENNDKKAKGKNKKEKPAKEKKTTDKKSKKNKATKDDSRKSTGSKGKTESKFSDIGLQTPYIYPCEQINLSEKGFLGKQVEELINEDIELPDELVVKMFVEYLKSLKNVKGWVLVNFPQTLCQTILLEENLTGRPVPSVCSDENISSSCTLQQLIDEYNAAAREEKNVKSRQSYLLTNPRPEAPRNFYDTHLSAYIKLKINAPPKNTNKNNHVPEEDNLTPDENLNAIEQFYTYQGCNYEYYYDVIDFPTLKKIAKIVIGDYTIPPKPSLQLFGPNFAAVEMKMTAADHTTDKKEKGKRGKEKSSKSSKASKEKSADGKKQKKSPKGAKGAKGTPVKLTIEDKQVQVPSVESLSETEMLDVNEHVEEASSTVLSEPEPGGPDWKYISISMWYTYEQKLSSTWENIEVGYLRNLRHFLLFHVYNINTHVPFTEYVAAFVKECDPLFNQIRDYVDEFQEILNEIIDCHHYGECIRCELQCRIVDLREKLWCIADDKLFYTKSIMAKIIYKNWIPYQIIELINLYILCLQTEMDRCVDTMQFINDYYICMIEGKYSKEQYFKKMLIASVQQHRNIFEIQAIILFINACLRNGRINDFINPIAKIIDSKCNDCFNLVLAAKATSYELITSTDSILNSTLIENYTKYAKTKKYFEPKKEVKEEAENIFREWKAAIVGETSRMQARLKLIKRLCLEESKNIINLHIRQHQNINKNISDSYRKTIYDINKICEIFSRAVDRKKRLDSKFILGDSKRYLESYDYLFQDEDKPEDVTLPEILKLYQFTSEQLHNLINLFYDLAPTSYISKRAFTYLLQDLAICERKEVGKFLPETWYHLTANNLATLVDEMFGHFDQLDWKDFILYNLYLPLPTHEELLTVRSSFRQYDPNLTETISVLQFFSVRLWFESCDRFDCAKLNDTRDILIRLFEIKPGVINYSKLLFLFCKDNDPTLGFAKALELSIGRYVCYDRELGKDFIDIVMTQRYEHEQLKLLREAEYKENVEMVRGVLSSVASTTVHLCDSILIEDYYSDKVEEEVKYNSSNDFEGDEDDENSSIFSEFSNVSVGFECKEYPNLIYILPYKSLKAIIIANMPRRFEMHKIYMDSVNVVYEQCRHPDFNNEVLVHEFLHNVHFQMRLKDFYRFRNISPAAIVSQLLNCQTAIPNSVL